MSSRYDKHDFRPTASWKTLKLRAEMLQKLRASFDTRGFLEVETPLLSHDTVIDRHLDPVPVTLADDPRQPQIGEKMFLQTSPEFAMKRLLAAGAGAIYQITKSFRLGERGAMHNPEFTIVEWYRPGDDMRAGMQLLSDLCEALLARGPAEMIDYRTMFQRHVFSQQPGVDPHTANIADFQAAAKSLGLTPPELGDDRDAWLNWLLTERVDPHLGVPRPTILYHWPASQAALAKLTSDQPPLAERFELYVDGVELANGYHELCDAGVLRKRQQENNRQRGLDGKPALPEENRLLNAMEAGLPACTGVALGFDRLVMVAAGARDIADVLAFPVERA